MIFLVFLNLLLIPVIESVTICIKFNMGLNYDNFNVSVFILPASQESLTKQELRYFDLLAMASKVTKLQLI